MSSPAARLYLFAALKADKVLILRRKPSQVFHLMVWDLQSDEIEHGSWLLKGKLSPLRGDLSPDGDWMCSFVTDPEGTTYNRISRPPDLAPVVQIKHPGSYFGGGYFTDSKHLRCNGWHANDRELPFKLKSYEGQYGGEELSVLYPRLHRDGWRRKGKNFGRMEEVRGLGAYTAECIGDDGWFCKPSRKHPELSAYFRGYTLNGYTFEFELSRHPQICAGADWACWDAQKQLLIARQGAVERWSLDDLGKGQPGQVRDFEDLQPPS